MATSDESRIFLLPGEFHVSRNFCEIATLLGSCVAVCLLHKSKPYSAMNHYLLATATSISTGDKGRFGDTSTETILSLLYRLDSDASKYEARIYGGAAVIGHLGSQSDIGTRNIEVARVILKKHGIPIVDEEIGGTHGRRIYFHPNERRVIVKVIHKTEEIEALERKRADIASRKTRVLVVDDSPLVRKILCKAINDTQDMEVCGEAGDPFEARDQILETNPDVISLDIIMPRMDGLSFLQKLSAHYPTPVVICSTIAKAGSDIANRADYLGAVDIVDKDKLEIYKGPQILKTVYIPKLRIASGKVVKKKLFD